MEPSQVLQPGNVTDSVTFFVTSLDPFTSVTCAHGVPAFICEMHRVPVVINLQPNPWRQHTATDKNKGFGHYRAPPEVSSYGHVVPEDYNRFLLKKSESKWKIPIGNLFSLASMWEQLQLTLQFVRATGEGDQQVIICISQPIYLYPLIHAKGVRGCLSS